MIYRGDRHHAQNKTARKQFRKIPHLISPLNLCVIQQLPTPTPFKANSNQLHSIVVCVCVCYLLCTIQLCDVTAYNVANSVRSVTKRQSD